MMAPVFLKILVPRLTDVDAVISRKCSVAHLMDWKDWSNVPVEAMD